MPPYRLLALDVDGTLLDPTHQLRQATVAAVRECLAAGIHVAVATGRLPTAISWICEAIGLSGPQVVVNGAFVVDIGSSAVLVETLLGDERLALVEAAVRELAVPYCAFTHEGIYALPEMQGLEVLQQFNEPEPKIVPALRSAYVPRIGKLLTVDSDQTHDAAMKTLLGDAVTVVRAHQLFLEYLAPGASKGYGLTTLASWLDIPMGQTAVIGDSYNDLSMFAVAGLSIAMGQAPAAVQAQAHQVTASNDHDGVALAIRQYIL